MAFIGFCLGALAAYFVYREATQTSYTRVPYDADIETDTQSYGGARRPGSGDALRRREPHVYTANANGNSSSTSAAAVVDGGRSNGHAQNIIPSFSSNGSSSNNGVCSAQQSSGSAAPLLPVSNSTPVRYGTQ